MQNRASQSRPSFLKQIDRGTYIWFISIAAVVLLLSGPRVADASLGPHLFSDGFPAVDTYRMEIVDVSIRYDGDIYVVGNFWNTIDLGNGPISSRGQSDIFVAEFTPEGDCVWARSWGGKGEDLVHAVVADTSGGDVVLVGEFQDTIDFGYTSFTSAGGRDAFLAVSTFNGGSIFPAVAFGGTGDQIAYDVDSDAGTGLIVVGAFENVTDFGMGPVASSGGFDGFIIRMDFTVGMGAVEQRIIGEASEEVATDVTVIDGIAYQIMVGGTFRDSTDTGGGTVLASGGRDIFVSQYFGLSLGTHIWSRFWGGSGDDVLYDLESDGLRVVSAGSFENVVDFGGGPLASAGGTDAFVVVNDVLGGPHVWSDRYGDAADQRATAVKSHVWGDLFVGGTFEGSIDLGGGVLNSTSFNDVFTARLDKTTGAHVWSAGHPGDGNQELTAVDIRHDGANPVWTGYFEKTIDWGLGQHSANGQEGFIYRDNSPTAPGSGRFYGWSEGLGALRTRPSVAAGPADEIVMAGAFTGTIDLGGGPLVSAGGADVFLAMYDPGGGHLWSQRFGDAGNQWALDVDVAQTGTIALVGAAEDTVDFGGGQLASAGGTDAFIAVFDVTGSHVASGLYGDFESQRATAVAWDPGAGEIGVVGEFTGDMDLGGGPLVSGGALVMFAGRLDPTLGHLWSERYGLLGRVEPSAVDFDSLGNMVVCGDFEDVFLGFGAPNLVHHGGTDVFLARLGPTGSHLGSWSFGDGAHDHAAAMEVNSLGRVTILGHFAGGIDFGSGPFISMGSYDGYLAQVDLAGAGVWSRPFGDGLRQRAGGMAVDNYDRINVTVAGDGLVDFGGGPLFAAGLDDVFFARYLSHGNHVDSERWGDFSGDRPTDVAADGADNVILTGEYELSGDFGGGPLPVVRVPATFLAKFGAGSLTGADDRVPAPRSVSLSIAGANPAGRRALFSYAVPDNGPVNLAVYDVRGRLVARLVEGAPGAGTHETAWDLRNRRGARVSSGVYFVRLETRAGTDVKRVTIAR